MKRLIITTLALVAALCSGLPTAYAGTVYDDCPNVKYGGKYVLCLTAEYSNTIEPNGDRTITLHAAVVSRDTTLLDRSIPITVPLSLAKSLPSPCTIGAPIAFAGVSAGGSGCVGVGLYNGSGVGCQGKFHCADPSSYVTFGDSSKPMLVDEICVLDECVGPIYAPKTYSAVEVLLCESVTTPGALSCVPVGILPS